MRYFQSSVRAIYTEQYGNDSDMIIAHFPQITTIHAKSFYNCRNLNTALFPQVKTISSSAFESCKNLKTADFPQAEIIGGGAFRDCKNLETAKFPLATTIEVCAFSRCKNLKTTHFPQTEIIGQMAFQHCKELKTAHFPQVKTIGYYAFRYCKSLKKTHFPQATNIELGSFWHCDEIKTAHFPRATMIEEKAFYKCNNLKYIVLPEAVSDEERIRIGLRKNTVVIAAKDFDASLLQLGSPELIAKLYSQGAHIAKALLAMASAELTSRVTLIEILKDMDFTRHEKIHEIFKSVMEREGKSLEDDEKSEKATVNQSENQSQQPNNELSVSALTVFSQHFSSKTKKSYRKSQYSLGCVYDPKEMLLNLTNVNQDELDRIKQGFEDSLSKTVVASLQHAPTPLCL